MDIIAFDCDIHRYGAPWTGLEPLTKPSRPTRDPLGKVWDVSCWVNGGDVYEINNCLKKNLSKALVEKQKYMDMVDVNVPGNHDLDKFEAIRQIKKIQDLSVAFEHGHMGSLWPYEKGYEYVHKNKPGCGYFKYAFCKALNWGRGVHDYKLKPDVLSRIQSTIKNEDVLILGHSHPKELIDEMVYVNGRFVRIFICPQGRNYFKVFKDDIGYMGKE